ncbi:Predicted arabinose efflux permease, MFS family [Chryseobacterium rhizoplanae]|uniref:Predicted arabinose efflux permease, MFS family n=1 Tax=Chryseobacterium rhizoplanae TaxID=1609531 RepID=A0A521BI09_9FLAO|nr:MFS transporter [Chryseobacterium rhizoplanae]SMO46541.1 Predicted arabinose efflux permease, MFS family [Chryseobacterium rhizoplanae]
MSTTLEKGQTINFYQATAPIIISVFGVYLTIGIALGVLPGFVQNTLGFDSIIVGLVIGLQSLSTLLTRAYSGKITDTRGAKKSKMSGVVSAVIAGIVYVLAVLFQAHPLTALIFLLLARIIHGVGESFLVTGALTWGIGLAGHSNSGKVMTWNGIAMYAGIAIGAPLSIWLSREYNIMSAFMLIALLPFVSSLSTTKLPSIPVDKDHVRTPFYKVIGAISGQGLSLAFSSMAFGCIASFIALFFSQKNWGDASLAFMIFGICYVLTRIFFASFPDKYGGFKIALISLIIEVAGQLLIWTSASKTLAIIGCGLTGVGFSLIFPALGVLAIRKVKPQMRGTALGAYVAFVDLSLGLAGPIAGLIAGWFNYQTVYLFGGISCIVSMIILLCNKK